MAEYNEVEIMRQDHEYDGIQELDNDLPPWWLYLFYFTIVFGVGYMAYYHVLGKGLSQAQEYAQEVAAINEAREAATGGKDPYEVGEATPEQIAEGKALFAANCAACHLPDGGGLIGPNLTDDAWIHGCSDEAIVNVIRKGVPAKGMIAWESTLRPNQIVAVTQFIKTLKGTTPATPKVAEGTPCGE